MSLVVTSQTRLRVQEAQNVMRYRKRELGIQWHLRHINDLTKRIDYYFQAIVELLVNAALMRQQGCDVFELLMNVSIIATTKFSLETKRCTYIETLEEERSKPAYEESDDESDDESDS